MSDSNSPKIHHTLLENGVHEFSLADSSMSSATAYMAELEKLYQTRSATSPTLRILFNGGTGTLPINYTMQRGKELSAKYPNVGLLRIAILTDKMIEIRLVDSFMRLIRFANTRTRFFELSRREDALNWLLQDD
ncbi:MAG: STAS/SEC14 domain-containing protein [Chloroflexota bacterium]